MNGIFNAVAQALDAIAALTGFTYNEINIIAYYMLLPLIYIALLDRILGRHVLKVLFAAAWIGILCFAPDFRAFCDVLFQLSVEFLLCFSLFGLNYVAASVVVCVILPLIALAVLLYFAFPEYRHYFFRNA